LGNYRNEVSALMANKLTESYAVAWLKWHTYRRFKDRPAYATMWDFRKYVHDCPPGGLFIDCGANVGDASRLLLAKGFTVHAFEPDPMAAKELCRRLGNEPCFHFHAAAVGATPGHRAFYRRAGGSLDDTQGSSLLHRPEMHGEAIDVEVIDLFAFIESLESRVDVLKLDVEGAEAEILERMLDERTYLRIGRIYVETHEPISLEIADRLARCRQRISEEAISNIDLGWG
jgi:FkbM family methyltransferase